MQQQSLFEIFEPRPVFVRRAPLIGYQLIAIHSTGTVASYARAPNLDSALLRCQEELPSEDGFTDHSVEEVD